MRTHYLLERLLIKHILGAAIAAFAISGQATVLTFEGATTGANRQLGVAGADSFGPSLLNYGGYDWIGMMVAKPNVSVGRPQQIIGFEEDEGRQVPLTTPVDAGFHRSAQSGDTVAFTQHFSGATSLMAGVKASAGAGNFDFNSVFLTAAWLDNIGVRVTGFRDGVSVYDLNFVVDHDGPTLFNLGFLNIDEIHFTTSGGDFLYANGSRIGDYSNPGRAFSTPILAFDNMDISAAALAVPEPGSLALFGLGVLGLIASRRRTRASS